MYRMQFTFESPWKVEVIGSLGSFITNIAHLLKTDILCPNPPMSVQGPTTKQRNMKNLH